MDEGTKVLLDNSNADDDIDTLTVDKKDIIANDKGLEVLEVGSRGSHLEDEEEASLEYPSLKGDDEELTSIEARFSSDLSSIASSNRRKSRGGGIWNI